MCVCISRLTAEPGDIWRLVALAVCSSALNLTVQVPVPWELPVICAVLLEATSGMCYPSHALSPSPVSKRCPLLHSPTGLPSLALYHSTVSGLAKALPLRLSVWQDQGKWLCCSWPAARAERPVTLILSLGLWSRLP